jgi:hypothetical protein
MIISDLLAESAGRCPECGGPAFSDLILAEKKDACYHKVKASAKVWPSAYASGRLVQCRKKGAANYGNKSEGVAEGSVTKKPQPYNEPNWTKKLPKEKLDAIAGPSYKKDKKEQGVAEADNPAQQAAIAIAKKKKQRVSEAADNTAFRQGYERGIRYYRSGPQNPYQPGTLEHTDYNDGYQMGEADSYDKYDTSSMDENSR